MSAFSFQFPSIKDVTEAVVVTALDLPAATFTMAAHAPAVSVGLALPTASMSLAALAPAGSIGGELPAASLSLAAHAPGLGQRIGPATMSMIPHAAHPTVKLYLPVLALGQGGSAPITEGQIWPR